MDKHFFSRQGQLFALDLVLSLVGSIIIFVVILALWNEFGGRLNDNKQREELNLEAFQISDILVSSRGMPSTWETNSNGTNPISPILPGLMLNPGELSNAKINAFVTLDYNTTKRSFNIERSEYYFQLQDTNGTILQSAGIPPTKKAKQAISVLRLSTLNNETVQLQFTFWTQ